MYSHFYITYYIQHDNMKLETSKVPTVNDLCTSTGTHTTTLSSTDVADREFMFEFLRQGIIIGNYYGTQPATGNELIHDY